MPTEQEMLEEKMRKLGPLELIAYLEKELKITQEGFKNARCKGCARHFFSKKIKTIEQQITQIKESKEMRGLNLAKAPAIDLSAVQTTTEVKTPTIVQATSSTSNVIQPTLRTL